MNGNLSNDRYVVENLNLIKLAQKYTFFEICFQFILMRFKIIVSDVINYHNLCVCLINFAPYIKLISKMRSGHDSVDN